MNVTLPTTPTEWINFYLCDNPKNSEAIASPLVSKVGAIDSAKIAPSAITFGNELDLSLVA